MTEDEALFYALLTRESRQIENFSIPELVVLLGGKKEAANTLGLTVRTMERWLDGTRKPSAKAGGRRRVETAVLTRHGVSNNTAEVAGLHTQERRRKSVDKAARRMIQGNGEVIMKITGDISVAGSSPHEGDFLAFKMPKAEVRKRLNAFIRTGDVSDGGLVMDAARNLVYDLWTGGSNARELTVNHIDDAEFI